MAYEDFTTYTEVDSHGDIVVTSSKCDVTTMQRLAASYVRADKGADHFGDFEHLITMRFATSDSTGNCAIWALSNGQNTIEEMTTDNVGLVAQLYQDAGNYRLYAWDFANDNNDSFIASANTVYYLTLKRDGTTFTIKIYSDSARTNLLDTLTMTCANTTYRYIYAVASRDKATETEVITAYSENLDLQEAPAITGGYAIVF